MKIIVNVPEHLFLSIRAEQIRLCHKLSPKQAKARFKELSREIAIFYRLDYLIEKNSQFP